MAVMTTLVTGSELINDFTNLTFVEVLFAKGFSDITSARLVATFLPSLGVIRFRLDEATNDMVSYPISESFIKTATANGSTATVYSKTGAILIIKINTVVPSYASYMATATTAGQLEAFETLVFTQNTNVAVSNYLNYTQRDRGVSIFDKAYLAAFNKRMVFNASVKGVIVFAVEGFNTSKTWIAQEKNTATGDIYLSFACSATGVPADFGIPVLVAKNIGTLLAPTYILPTTAYTNMPATRYAYSAGSYYVTTGNTSPYPYLIATTPDGLNKVAFTVDVSTIDKVYVGTTEVDYDFGSHYLGLFKSVTTTGIYGIGGAISSDLLGGSLLVSPLPRITGVRVINIGGTTETDIKLKQRSATVTNQVVLNGVYPSLDMLNRVYLSASENNPTNQPLLYGTEVDISESGTYIIRTQAGGTVTVTTNRLFYNPYYNGYDSLKFTTVDFDLFNAVTPAKVLAGDTEYKCFYVKNRHPTKTFSNVTLWSDYNCNYGVIADTNPQYMQLGMFNDGNRTGDGTTNPILTGSAPIVIPTPDVIAARLAAGKILAGFISDPQDYIYVPPVTPIPNSVDLRTYTWELDDQLSVGSCTANAVSSACEMFLTANNQSAHLSRLFNYYESRNHAGLLPGDNGAYTRDAIEAARVVGFPYEITWPYVVAEYNTVPSGAAYTEAAQHKIDRYELITKGSDATYIQHMCAALSEGFPIVVSMPLTDAFHRITGDFTYQLLHPYIGTGINNSVPTTGYHAVVLVGYSSSTRTFILENSWGATWGYQGYALFPFDTLHDIYEAWAIRGFQGLTIPTQTPFVIPTPTGATPPDGIVFDFRDAESTGLNIVNLGPQESVPIWVKRVVNPSTTIVKEDMLSYLRMKVTY